MAPFLVSPFVLSPSVLPNTQFTQIVLANCSPTMLVLGCGFYDSIQKKSSFLMAVNKLALLSSILWSQAGVWGISVYAGSKSWVLSDLTADQNQLSSENLPTAGMAG